MRYLIIVLVFLISVQGDEIKRIESIVQDITKLRKEQAVCVLKLEESLKVQDDLLQKEKQYKKRIKYLERKLKKQEKLLRSNLSNQQKVQSRCKNSDNSFPPLMMKPEYVSKKIEYFKASPFRLTKESDIYDDIDGKKIDRWEAKTSFTSNQRTAKWVKITGYFVDKQWRRAQKDMWVKASNVLKRN